MTGAILFSDLEVHLEVQIFQVHIFSSVNIDKHVFNRLLPLRLKLRFNLFSCTIQCCDNKIDKEVNLSID